MDLQTFELVVTIAFLCALGLGAGLFAGLNGSLQEQIEKTEDSLRRLASALGFESYRGGWSSNSTEIYFDYTDKSPASRNDVERFLLEQSNRLEAVYKHLGIKVEKKVTPAKEEVVVTKLVK